MKISPSLKPPGRVALGVAPPQAHLLCLLFASSYVGSIYITQHFFLPRANRSPAPTPAQTPSGQNGTTGTGPPVPPVVADEMDAERDAGPKIGSRDHPTTIRMRMRAVGLATASNMLVVLAVVKVLAGCSWTAAMVPTLRLLGLEVSFPTQIGWTEVLPYLLTPILFLGPLYAEYLDKSLPFQRASTMTRRMEPSSWSLVTWRNYVVGPSTEELTFRSTILCVCLLARLSPAFLVFGTPLWFGVAHLHHALEVYRSGGSTKAAAMRALLGCLFQLTYTTLFGWFASYLFIRTGSILPPLSSHVFCNMMGIYLPSTAIRRHPTRQWSLWAAYLGGIAGFIWALRAL